MKSPSQTKIAQWVSLLFGPPIIAILTITILVLSTQASGISRLNWWLTCVMMAVLVPFGFIFWLYRLKRVETVYLHQRRERTVPYAMTVVCLLVTLYTLNKDPAPPVFQALIVTYLANTLMLLFFNFYRKISAHAVGLTSSLVVLWAFLGPLVIPGFVVVAVVAWARIYLQAHTRAEVLIGFLAALLLSGLSVTFFVPGS